MRWNKEEISNLKRMRDVENIDWDEIGLVLNRTYHACRVKYNKERRKVNVKNNNKSWTEADIKLLMGFVKKGIPLNEVARRLKRTTKAVQVKVGRELLPTDIVQPYTSPIPKPVSVKAKASPKPYKKSIKYSARISRHTINASTIFDYIKQLELENKELQQRIKDIQNLLN
tara:strand:+ start:2475 stop:2987 length:513 start_codon:yes stop_codon:yes gene_type:complete